MHSASLPRASPRQFMPENLLCLFPNVAPQPRAGAECPKPRPAPDLSTKPVPLSAQRCPVLLAATVQLGARRAEQLHRAAAVCPSLSPLSLRSALPLSPFSLPPCSPSRIATNVCMPVPWPPAPAAAPRPPLSRTTITRLLPSLAASACPSSAVASASASTLCECWALPEL